MKKKRSLALKEKIDQFKKKGIQKVKLVFTDIDGVLRGKYISLEKFHSIVNKTAGFCDCVLGWDVNDQLYDNAKFTGWHTAFPDAFYRIDVSTERQLPDENGTPLYIIEFVDEDKKSLHPICPRSLLKRVLEKLHSMGFGAHMAFEYEFFVFRETPLSIREKNFRNLTPLSPGNFGYSVIRNSAESNLFQEFMDYCTSMNFPLEALHCETGPGVLEAAINYDEALIAADKAVLFKTFSKVFFQKRNLLATFMAKWSMDYPGMGGHVHQSLFDLKTKKNIFYSPGKQGNMSSLMESYVAGQQKYLKPFLAMSAPTINSYTRLVKGAWAPTSSTWGIDNRTTALRVIPGNEKSQRVEFRIGSADANPYLTAASNLITGILGIEEKLKLGRPVKGNAYEIEDKISRELKLPSNLRDSIRNFSQSKEAKKLLGHEFVDHFIASREWEVREYEKAITDWQLQRYFEII